MPELGEVIVKVYSFTNRLKIALAMQNYDSAFTILNNLSAYLVSIEPPNNASTGQEPVTSAQAEFDALGERLANNHRKLSGSCR